MRTELNISLQFKQFYYHHESYEWTTEMPHFWFSFFKIDGSNCKINDTMQLEGSAEIYCPAEKFESLKNIEADKEDIIQIPVQTGRKDIVLTPIPVPDFVKKNKIDNLESYVGCIAVLVNEECALSDEKKPYVKILKLLIQNELNKLIYTLNEEEGTIQQHLENLKEKIIRKVTEEARKNQSFWKRFTTENIVEATIWIFSSDEITALNQASMVKHWGKEGIWELSGKIKIRKKQSHEMSVPKLNPNKCKQKVQIH